MEAIPPFSEAVQSLRSFLRAEQHPDQVVWAFREDLYSTGASRHRVAWPLPSENELHARQLFEAGRTRGLVELLALFRVGNHTVVTVDAPLPDEIQGWSHGLKLAVRQPFVAAKAIQQGLAWRMHRVRPAYRRFQRFEGSIPRRRPDDDA